MSARPAVTDEKPRRMIRARTVVFGGIAFVVAVGVVVSSLRSVGLRSLMPRPDASDVPGGAVQTLRNNSDQSMFRIFSGPRSLWIVRCSLRKCDSACFDDLRTTRMRQAGSNHPPHTNAGTSGLYPVPYVLY